MAVKYTQMDRNQNLCCMLQTARHRLCKHNNKQKFTEPEIEVKWYCDSIEEIVIVYVRIQKQA